MQVATNDATTTAGTVAPAAWLQLAMGVIVMMAISSPQYVWTLFTKPLGEATHAAPASVQVTFSILVVLQTWLSPAQGFLIDRIGPKLLVALGAALSGLGWITASGIDSLIGLYLTYGVLCGIGTGFVYVGIVGLMVRWFENRRGFAVGAVAAGYGMGALLTTFPIATMIKAAGYQHTLFVFGLILGGVGIAAALFLRNPRSNGLDAVNQHATTGATPREMLRSPVFWLMFAMMTMMSTGGLMVTSQFATFAKDFGVAEVLVLGLPALTLALTFDRFTNGLTRPFFGWVSDRIGRENTMALAFALEAAAITLMLTFRTDPVAFVLLSGVVFFGWGEIFSLFPSTLTDTFGTRHAAANYGFLYMSQGIGSILGGPLASLLHDQTKSWLPVFGIAIAMDLITATLALLVLKPLRRRSVATGVSPLGLDAAAGVHP